MTWADDLEKARRFLRDPNGNIWSDAYLRHEYNDVQQDFQSRTQFLEDVAVQRVPGLYQGAYLFEWERRYLDVTVPYRALTRHDDFAICGPWEAQEITGLQPGRGRRRRRAAAPVAGGQAGPPRRGRRRTRDSS